MKSLKSRLFHQLNVNRYQPKNTVLNALARPILGDMDKVLSDAYSALSDMGIPRTEFDKIKRIVKKRL